MTGGPDGSVAEDAAARLAIVIPAWRARHFAAALDSLRNQTDRRFRLYVGDDSSPDDLKSLVEVHAAGLQVSYHRFPGNLGGRDLVAHWHRCIALSRGEPWIWLFSDDDIAEPGCVAEFHRHFETGDSGATLLRFNVVFIDGEGRQMRRPAPHPVREDAMELLAAMYRGGERSWCAPDHLFRRDAFDRSGGFVPFPRAIYSDFATWVKIAALGHVRTLPSALVHFRRHEAGTSSGLLMADRERLAEAIWGFSQYSLAFTRRHAPERLDEHIRLSRRHVRRLLELLLRGISPAELSRIAGAARRARHDFFSPVWCVREMRARRLYRSLPGLRLVAAWRHHRLRILGS